MGGFFSSIIKIGPVTSSAASSSLLQMGGFFSSTDDVVYPWDYKGCNKIIQIFISYGEKGINSLQFQHEQNGSLVMSKCHGSITGDKFVVVTLNHPMESITSISGYRTCPSYSTSSIFSSLSFSTNIRNFGPFGRDLTHDDKEFSFHVGQYSQFWGFHGSCNRYGLRSIGIYLKPITTLPTALDQKVVVPKKEAE